MSKEAMNTFEEALCSSFGAENLKKIQEVTVGIAGAGGLGSNCAVNLVRSGFRKLVIVDFDEIECSNLNRQFYFYHQIGRTKVGALKENLLAINSNLQIEISQVRIEEDNVGSIFHNCSIIVEAFDKAHYKKMLVEEYINTDKLVVSASGIAGWSDSDDIKIHRIRENFYIVGDLTSEVSQELPPCAPRVSIAAAKQADIILNYALKGRQ